MFGRFPSACGRALLPIAAAAIVAGCSEKDEGMVRVFGMVVNIDTGVPAEGVVVHLLDQPEHASPPTGADGAFFLRVPTNSPFTLVTNDWAGLDRDSPPGTADDWITFINVEPAKAPFTNDEEIVIHACPTEGSPRTWGGGAPGLGSVAVWRNFLQNSTMAASYTDVTDVDGKILVGLIVGTPPNQELGFPVAQLTGFSLQIMEPGVGKVGYWSVPDTFNSSVPGFEGNDVQDASVGPDMFVPNATEAGPGVSLWTIFANSTYGGDEVTLMYAEENATRGVDFSGINPVVVPVRDHATTLVSLGVADNVISPLYDGLCAAGYISCGD